ncbi:MAG: Mov34/MPN/PAD-1 family protein [Gemmatimonadota bacterium]
MRTISEAEQARARERELAIVEQIRIWAKRADGEICGALIGDGTTMVGAVPLSNQSIHAQDSFLIPAAEVLRLERDAESRGQVLAGFYHSHPASDAMPSRRDLEQAVAGYIYWIASRTGAVRAWRLREDRSGFDEMSIAHRDDN